MKTLGIDLSSDPRNTGVCVVRWGNGEAVVEEVAVGADDEELLTRSEAADVVGIDCPFGWPVVFEELLRGNRPLLIAPWSTAKRDRLRFRLTDLRVRELTGRWPLSVSSDLIAVPAMRCVGLLARMGVDDRSGNGRVYETYPAAGLARWGLPSRGYKGKPRRAVRESLWLALRERTPWLRVSADREEALLAQDDALDALVAALIARAARLGLTIAPTERELLLARTEGWIHMPDEGSLEGLATDPR